MIRNNIHFLFIIFITSIIFVSCKNATEDNLVNPTGKEMSLVGSVNTSGDSRGVAIGVYNSKSYAFIADGSSGLRIIEVTFPSIPLSTGNFNTNSFSYEVVLYPVNGINYAFVSDGAGGLVIFDVSNLASPVPDTIIQFTNDVIISSAVSGNNLYIAGFSGQVYIYDISTLPGIVNQLSVYNAADNINHIEVSNGTAYITEENLGLEIFNVSNPSTPTSLGAIDTPGDSYDVRIGSHYAFIADGDAGLTIIDVTNPSNPLIAGTSYSNGPVMGVCYVSAAVQPQIYTAEFKQGAEAFDISNISSPKALGYYNTSGFSYDVAYYNGYVFIADGLNGLVILKY